MAVENYVVFDVPDEENIFTSASASKDLPELGQDDPPTHASVLVEYLKTVVPSSNIDKERLCDPRDVLDQLLGEPSQAFSELCKGAFDSYVDAIASAVDVLSPSDEHKFNVLDAEREMKFLRNCDVEVHRRMPTINILMENVGTYILCARERTCARLLMTVHMLKKLFTRDWRAILGSEEQISARLTDEYYQSIDMLGTHKSTLLGRFEHWDSLVYELLAVLAYNDLRFSVCTRFTEVLLNAEYHMLRPAVDAMGTHVLHVCLFSASYFLDVWSAYMRLYYPRIFKEHDVDESDKEAFEEYARGTELPRWSVLRFYEPMQEIAEQPNHAEMLEFLVCFFKHTFTEQFLRSFKRIHVPEGYDVLIEQIFKKPQRPKRECVRPAVILKPLRQRQRRRLK